MFFIKLEHFNGICFKISQSCQTLLGPFLFCHVVIINFHVGKLTIYPSAGPQTAERSEVYALFQRIEASKIDNSSREGSSVGSEAHLQF